VYLRTPLVEIQTETAGRKIELNIEGFQHQAENISDGRVYFDGFTSNHRRIRGQFRKVKGKPLYQCVDSCPKLDPSWSSTASATSLLIVFSSSNYDMGSKRSYPRCHLTQWCALIVMNDCIRQTISFAPISFSKVFVAPATSATALISGILSMLIKSPVPMPDSLHKFRKQHFDNHIFRASSPQENSAVISVTGSINTT
jgi:hypothetical protein